MASRIFYPFQALQRETKLVAGSFAPNGSSALSSASVKGKGFTVARSDVGVYTVTLEDSYAEIVGEYLGLRLASDADNIVRWAAIDVVTAKTLVIHSIKGSDGTTAVEIAANANNRISFALLLRSTTTN